MHSADRVKGSHAIAGCPSWNCAGQAVAELAVEFVAVLEQSEDRHPLVNLAKKRKIESPLAGPAFSRLEGAAFSAPTKRYNKVVKLDPEGDRCWIEVAQREKKAWDLRDRVRCGRCDRRSELAGRFAHGYRRSIQDARKRNAY